MPTARDDRKVRMSPPPPRLMRMVNPLVRVVLKSRLLGARIGAVMLIEVRGRRSGHLLRIPVARHVIDGQVLVFTGRTWRHNFEGGAPTAITHRARRSRAWGVLLDAPPHEVGSAIRAALENGTSPFVVGVSFPRGHQPTVAELSTLGASLIRFETREGTEPADLAANEGGPRSAPGPPVTSLRGGAPRGRETEDGSAR